MEEASSALGADVQEERRTIISSSSLPARETPWTIYLIRLRESGRSYVGVTQRPLAARLRAHWHDAGRSHLPRPGGLRAALQDARRRGDSLEDVLVVATLGTATTPAQARRLEAAMIMRHGTMHPRGLNLMPGGASLGGPRNRRPLRILHPVTGRMHRFHSVEAAHAALCAGPRAAGLPPAPSLGLVHARLAAGWHPLEALGLLDHDDGRGQLPGGARYAGKPIGALREVARDDLSIATLRSRRHRARLAGVADADLAVPRPRGSRQLGRRLLPLPDPRRPGEGRTLGCLDFARLAGVPVATVTHRLHRLLRQGHDVAAMPDGELVALLAAPPADRRRVLLVALPDGRRVEGGFRELVRLVEGDPALQPLRREILSASGMRRRLRLLPARPTDAAVLHALGLGPLPDG